MWRLPSHSVIWEYGEIYGIIVMSQDRKLLIQSVEKWYDKKYVKDIVIEAGKLPKESVAYKYLKKSTQIILIQCSKLLINSALC